MAFETLFDKYDRLVLFDTETTGLLFSRDEIIEFAAVVVENRNGIPTVVQQYDELITLSPGGFVPPKIEELTGISTQDIRERGLPKARVAQDIARMFKGNTLLLAYNAHFDLSFLYYFLLRNGDPMILKGKDKLDLLTVYKDRRPYPHKLFHAIEAYGVEAENTHRAIDDTKAAWEVLCAMERECADLEQYINLFGYNPKFGVSGPKISSIRYVAQPYRMNGKLYEQ